MPCESRSRNSARPAQALGDIVGQRHGETGEMPSNDVTASSICAAKISAIILKIMHRTAHHRHRIIQRRTQRGEPLRSDRIVRRLGHRFAGLRLHDRTSQQVPHIVVDLAGDTRAFASVAMRTDCARSSSISAMRERTEREASRAIS